MKKRFPLVIFLLSCAGVGYAAEYYELTPETHKEITRAAETLLTALQTQNSNAFISNGAAAFPLRALSAEDKRRYAHALSEGAMSQYAFLNAMGGDTALRFFIPEAAVAYALLEASVYTDIEADLITGETDALVPAYYARARLRYRERIRLKDAQGNETMHMSVKTTENAYLIFALIGNRPVLIGLTL